MRCTFPLVLWLTFAACGESGGVSVDERHDAIVGGTETLGEPEVFLLQIAVDGGMRSTCSATLIGTHTLVTAAHCVDPLVFGAERLDIQVSNAATRDEVTWGVTSLTVQETKLHPDWRPAFGLGNDLALLRLNDALGVAPKAWNVTSLDGLSGEPVRALGYGASGADAGMGVKRTVDLTIRQLSNQLITLGNEVDRGICHGDSGGPTFHRFPDGVERLVGVHSFTQSSACVDGADSRVDFFAGFIRDGLANWEDACVTTQVCSTTACATPDPDCVPDGEACTRAWECAGRLCTGDAQHSIAYCTRACVTASDCGGGLACDSSLGRCVLAQRPEANPGEICVAAKTLCLHGSQCIDGRCSVSCDSTDDCDSGMECLAASTGGRTCQHALRGPSTREPQPVPEQCSTTAPTILPLIILLHFRRRRT